MRASVICCSCGRSRVSRVQASRRRPSSFWVDPLSLSLTHRPARRQHCLSRTKLEHIFQKDKRTQVRSVICSFAHQTLSSELRSDRSHSSVISFSVADHCDIRSCGSLAGGRTAHTAAAPRRLGLRREHRPSVRADQLLRAATGSRIISVELRAPSECPQCTQICIVTACAVIY